MSERTIITTLEVTKVYKHLPECFDLDKKAWGNGMAEITKDALDSDDVVVTNVQEFEGWNNEIN
jgi:hypothetical protein